MARVVLGVAGGIAAYKVCSALRLLREGGHEVRVVPTEAALKFVGAATWEALSGAPVSADVFDRVPQVEHVQLGRWADAVLVAPATADVLARAAHGLAGDLLGNVLLTATCPTVFAPAMHTEMWHHAATVANVETLRRRGVLVLEPAVGRLTGPDTGPGRMPEPEELAEAVVTVLDMGGVPQRDLDGVRVVITAGGTREPLDPVRYLGNRSSGKQGYALAAAARDRGADVTLIAANCSLPDPAAVPVRQVATADELHSAVHEAAECSDVLVMAAAVADYRPAEQRDVKVKKDSGGLSALELAENPDILAELVANRDAHGSRRPLLVGFAAETGDHRGSAHEHGRNKFWRKGCDALVVNEVGVDRVFGRDDNEVMVVTADGELLVPQAAKRVIAHAVWDVVVSLLEQP